MDWVSLPFVQLGAVGVVFAGVWLVFTGRLIARSTYNSLKEVHVEAIARLQEENKEWKEAWRTSEATKEVMTNQLRELIEVGKTTEALVRSIKGEAA